MAMSSMMSYQQDCQREVASPLQSHQCEDDVYVAGMPVVSGSPRAQITQSRSRQAVGRVAVRILPARGSDAR